MNPSYNLSSFVSNLKYEDLPREVITETKYRILDWLGSALAGVYEQPSVIAKKVISKIGGEEQSTLLKGGIKVPVSNAAWANGIIGHVMECDDGHKLAITHPGAVAVPTSLAVAEGENRTGKDIITAVVSGYEIMIRLGRAINPSHYKYWHTSGTCGAFAAAASAGSILKLDSEKMLMSFGIAGTMASGLQETFGSNAKPLNIGHACQSGIISTYLAREGFTGPDDIICGKKGFINAMSDKSNKENLTENLGEQFLISTAMYKIYPSCGHTHSPLEATFNIIKNHDIKSDNIERINVITYKTSVELTGEFKNNTPEEAKFSLPYCIAAALIYKKLTLEEFTEDRLNEKQVVKLAQKVKVDEDPGISRKFPQDRTAIVTITLSDGSRLKDTVCMPQGHPDHKFIEDKFMSLACMNIDEKMAINIKEMVFDMENKKNLPDIYKLLS